MARRRSSLAEDVMDRVARLPWWLGVLLAIVSHLLLRPLAQRPLPPYTPGTSIAMPAMVQGLAAAGQIALPLLCLAGAGVSAWRRRQRRGLARDAAQRPAMDAVNGMSWREFELLVGEAFRQQGYRVAETGGGGPDGGVDLLLAKPGANGSEKYLVQCKHWRAWKVGVGVVRELYGVMAATGAAGGYVVTAGRFTDEAVRFAEGRNVVLVEGAELVRMIRGARSGGSG
ncbi:restriction endonuclease [Aquincola sp. MAHUQ-54]|uniref:Restriction endonuclease n=1 Tax=Aquincola agrisoli TaxID=3119538 RepID=A0AAW9QEZ0_9BURK